MDLQTSPCATGKTAESATCMEGQNPAMCTASDLCHVVHRWYHCLLDPTVMSQQHLPHPASSRASYHILGDASSTNLPMPQPMALAAHVRLDSCLYCILVSAGLCAWACLPHEARRPHQQACRPAVCCSKPVLLGRERAASFAGWLLHGSVSALLCLLPVRHQLPATDRACLRMRSE